MCIGLAQSYESFLLFRLAIRIIGASFVITLYHTSVMFAPNVVGMANATTAGWGNLGRGITQMVMPLIVVAVIMLRVNEATGRRVAMVVPRVALFFTGIAYYFLTQDAPKGNSWQLRLAGEMAPSSSVNGSFLAAAKNHRVWALFIIYGARFGIELTINNVAALYYHDRFGLSIGVAGLIACLFGMINIFARILGGVFGDKAGIKFGLRGRVMFTGCVLLLEGLALVLFSQMASLFLAVGAMIFFSLFVQMSEGATYSVVPFINRKALGSVAGIVGAGGNAGAVAAGFLFRVESLSMEQAQRILGVGVALVAPLAFLVRFTVGNEAYERHALERALAEPAAASAIPAPVAGD